ncbi:hypothetical protein [Bradyrhizobium sp. B120]|uniref:hypothetical protein n=1 Tax=Bradyrhizobium sp. B120 TaxID=3410088 RepID=UPI003B97E050
MAGSLLIKGISRTYFAHKIISPYDPYAFGPQTSIALATIFRAASSGGDTMVGAIAVPAVDDRNF